MSLTLTKGVSMKMLMTIALLAISTVSFAGELDGLTFCRDVHVSGGLGMGPARVRKHCISFQDDVATDNGPTFFGKLTEHFHYTIKKEHVINTEAKTDTDYIVDGEKLVKKDAQIELLRQ
jgi:fermentation-respiration switch protein FrsA (DUF1100 family)